MEYYFIDSYSGSVRRDPELSGVEPAVTPVGSVGQRAGRARETVSPQLGAWEARATSHLRLILSHVSGWQWLLASRPQFLST